MWWVTVGLEEFEVKPFFCVFTGYVECSSSCWVSTWSQRLWLCNWKCAVQLGVSFTLSLCGLLQWDFFESLGGGSCWKESMFFRSHNSSLMCSYSFSNFCPFLCLCAQLCWVIVAIGVILARDMSQTIFMNDGFVPTTFISSIPTRF